MGFEPERKPLAPWGRAAPATSRFQRRFFVLAAIGTLLLFCIVSLAPPRQWDGIDQMILIRYALIAFIVVLLLAASQKSLPRIAGELGLWFTLMLVLVAGYSYRFELRAIGDRITAELLPSRGQGAPGAVSFTRAQDQHFWIDAVVDGEPVHFLVDTGASGVVLSRADAERLGFRWNRLAFTQIFETANGTTRGAPVELRQIRIGSIRFDHVGATVNEGELKQSLLGMRLLERLGSIEIRNDTLTIRE
ncbi:MAG TPA: TIGR02281 family clan AA aspartic protease [Aliidongia sp.]|nr:TIGR02281 family clan AA aspartic protease [Aliidongia sp.]